MVIEITDDNVDHFFKPGSELREQWDSLQVDNNDETHGVCTSFFYDTMLETVKVKIQLDKDKKKHYEPCQVFDFRTKERIL